MKEEKQIEIRKLLFQYIISLDGKQLIEWIEAYATSKAKEAVGKVYTDIQKLETPLKDNRGEPIYHIRLLRHYFEIGVEQKLRELDTKECDACNGSGENIYFDGDGEKRIDKCGRCNGTGKLRELEGDKEQSGNLVEEKKNE